jgi:hypothetical protein
MEALEKRQSDLETSIFRMQKAERPASEHSLADLYAKVEKLANDVQGLKMRMGKQKE